MLLGWDVFIMKKKKVWLTLPGLMFAIAVQAKEPTSIIYVIGDGMGFNYTSAYRYFSDNPSTPEVETTIFDELLVGAARTYPDDHTIITDSAAAATALATGVKTTNGAIGVDAEGKAHLTLLEAAKAKGYRTGLVVTSTINHATPASFVAHVGSRQSYDEIANQYFDQRIDNRPKVDVMLGGGRQFFAREDRDLTQEFVAEGYQYITELAQLQSLQQLPVLGLFAQDGLPAALDSDGAFALTAMTKKALMLLDQKPFFLLIEASQIDWCGHANDVACAMAEMQDLDATLHLVKAYVAKHPNTILVATADHSTGGLSMGFAGQYEWSIPVVQNIKATASKIADSLIASSKKHWVEEWMRLTSIELSVQETKTLQSLLIKAWGVAREEATKTEFEVVRNTVIAQTLTVINERSYTGWTSNGHTAEDVPILSYGKGREQFAGNLNNIDIAKKLFGYLPDNNGLTQ